MSGHGFSDLTRQRQFMRLWTARLFGTAGNQMQMVAVGWQMYQLTGSAWDLGLVGLHQFLPALHDDRRGGFVGRATRCWGCWAPTPGPQSKISPSQDFLRLG